MEENVVKCFKHKFVGFLWKDINEERFLLGYVKDIKEKCLVIDFKGQTQVYPLEQIRSIREIVDREKK